MYSMLKSVMRLHLLHQRTPEKIMCGWRSWTLEDSVKSGQTITTKGGRGFHLSPQFELDLCNKVCRVWEGLIWGEGEMDDSAKKLTLRGISCRVVLSEKQHNPPLFYFNSSNSTMELLIKYLGCWLRGQLLMWGDSHSLVEKGDHSKSSAGRLGELTKKDQNCRLWPKSQKGVFNQMAKCYQFQSACEVCSWFLFLLSETTYSILQWWMDMG